MTRIMLTMLVLFALCAHVAPAQAQLARTFVSSFGNDANDCGRSTPCRTFQRAHDATLTLGEITVLDPGGYGAVNITKGISIINDGVGEAGVLVSGGAIGITVNAGAGDRVSLRGLTVKGIGFGGGNGIRFNTGASLTIENCAVRNHTGDGIQMLGTVPAATRSTFVFSNTFVADNGGNGILVQPSGAGSLAVVLNRVEMYNNSANGLAVTSPIAIVVSLDSVAAFNGFSGFSATNQSHMTAKRSTSTNNQRSGFIADHAFVDFSETTAVYNTAADIACINSAAMSTYSDNIYNSLDSTTTCASFFHASKN